MRPATPEEIARITPRRPILHPVIQGLIEYPRTMMHIALNEMGTPGNLDAQMDALQALADKMDLPIEIKQVPGNPAGGFLAKAL